MGLFKKKPRERELITSDILAEAEAFQHTTSHTPCGTFGFISWILKFKNGTRVLHETCENGVVWHIGKKYSVWKQDGKLDVEFVGVR